jgi:GT2 family glycosyltransferase
MAGADPLVYCIVLNLNGRTLLCETLDSVHLMTYPNFKAIVVDNGSIDGSQDAVRTQYPWVELIENGKNLGFGGGNDVGMKYALEQGAEWIFLLNNDIAVDPELLSEMMNMVMVEDCIGAASPKIYYYSEPNKIWYAGGTINFWTGIVAHKGLRQIDAGQFDKTEETGFVNGCAFLVKREALEKVILNDIEHQRDFFDFVYHPIYAEDVDLSERIRRAGYKLMFVPKGKLWHKVSAFSGGGLTPFKTRLKVKHNFIFFKRYARWYHWITIPFCITAMTTLFVIKELFKGNFSIILALVQGFFGALGRLFSKNRALSIW